MHIGGIPNDVEKFYKLKKKYKFFLIEDSCHAFGSTYYLNNKNYKIAHVVTQIYQLFHFTH